MEVRKLEWVSTRNDSHIKDDCNLYHIFHPRESYAKYLPCCYFGKFISKEHSLGHFDTLEEAQEACQKHFDKFILDQIEPENSGNKSNVFDPTLIGFESIKESKLNYKFKKDNRYVLWQSKSLGDPVWNFIFDPRIKVDSEGQFIEFDALKNPNNIFEFFRHREFLDHEAGAEIVTKFLKERGLYA